MAWGWIWDHLSLFEGISEGFQTHILCEDHNLPPLASSDLNFVLNLRLKNMLMKIEA